MTTNLTRAEREHLPDLHAALLAERHGGATAVLLTIAAVVVTALVWSMVGRLDEITTGHGRVIPVSREQVIQSIEPGVLAELLVREGDSVTRGQVLMRIDDARSGAHFREIRERVLALSAQAARLTAEAEQRTPDFPAEVASHPELVGRELAAFAARRRALDEAVAALEASLRLGERERAITEPMARRGLVSEVELLRLNRQLTDLRGQLAERRNRYVAEANTELVRVAAELQQVREVMAGREDSLTRMTIRAPMAGIVKNVRLTTIGGVIQPGQDLLEIVPSEDSLLIEAYIRPSDVAFIRPGLPATVKLTAYDFASYGGLTGIIEHLSPDAMRDERMQGRTRNPVALEESFYRLLVRTDRAHLEHRGDLLPIIPGMTATVEIRTGEKTVFEYLVRPMRRVGEALRER